MKQEVAGREKTMVDGCGTLASKEQSKRVGLGERSGRGIGKGNVEGVVKAKWVWQTK